MVGPHIHSPTLNYRGELLKAFPLLAEEVPVECIISLGFFSLYSFSLYFSSSRSVKSTLAAPNCSDGFVRLVQYWDIPLVRLLVPYTRFVPLESFWPNPSRPLLGSFFILHFSAVAFDIESWSERFNVVLILLIMAL